jgi:hypothetical protein
MLHPAGLDDDSPGPADAGGGHGQNGTGGNFHGDAEGLGRRVKGFLDGDGENVDRHSRRRGESPDLGRLPLFLLLPGFLGRRITECGGNGCGITNGGCLDCCAFGRMAAGSLSRVDVEVDGHWSFPDAGGASANRTA